MCHIYKQEIGGAEEDFAACDTAILLNKFYSSRDPKPPRIPKEVGFRGFKGSAGLPSWLTEDDLNYFATKFNQKGFTGGLNYYRAMNLYVSCHILLILLVYIREESIC